MIKFEVWVKNLDSIFDDEGMWPIGNVYIPNERFNPVYKDRVKEYRSDKRVPAVVGHSDKNPPSDEYFWKKASPLPINPKYSILFVDDGVHRITAVIENGKKWVRATLNAKPGAMFFGFRKVRNG